MRISRPVQVAASLGALIGIVLVMLLARGNKTPSRLTFFVTGNSIGYLENCGCAGGQSGGMPRRAALLKAERPSAERELRSDDGRAADSLLLDTGDFSDPTDPRQKLRSEGIVKALGMMGYDAVGLGIEELNYTQDELFDLLSLAKLPYVAANLSFVKPTDSKDRSSELAAMVERYKILKTKSGYKVGLIHIIDNSGVERGEPLREGYQLAPPVDTAKQILQAHGREAQFWVVSVGSNHQYGLRPEDLAGLTNVKLVFGLRGYQPGNDSEGLHFPYFIEKPMEKGKDVVRAAVTFAEKGNIRIDGIKLAVREDLYKSDPDVKKMIEDFIKPREEKLENQLAEASLNKAKNGPLYLGHTECAICHAEIEEQMKGTKHMTAYATLKAEHKEHLACAQCHNVGYNGNGGFNVVEDAKIAPGAEWNKRNVQCENCHGPGEYHVKLHANHTRVADLTADGRDKEGLLPVTHNTCLTCHNPENSPHFVFSAYWPHIQHGKGLKPVPGSPPGAGMGPPKVNGGPGRGMNLLDPNASATTPRNAMTPSRRLALVFSAVQALL